LNLHRDTDIVNVKVWFVRTSIRLLSQKHLKICIKKKDAYKTRTEKCFCKMKGFHFYESEIWPLKLWGKIEFKIIENRALQKTIGFNCSKEEQARGVFE